MALANARAEGGMVTATATTTPGSGAEPLAEHAKALAQAAHEMREGGVALPAIEFRIDGSRQYRNFKRVELLQEADEDWRLSLEAADVADGSTLGDSNQSAGSVAGSIEQRLGDAAELKEPERRPRRSHKHNSTLVSNTTASSTMATLRSRHLHSAPTGVTVGGVRDVPFGTVGRPTSLQMRDLRAIDPAFAVSQRPTVLVRHNAIVVNLPPIKAIILSRKCIVFLVGELEYGADSVLATIMDWLCGAWPPSRGEEPVFEFKAMEAILSTVCAAVGDANTEALTLVARAVAALQAHQTKADLTNLRLVKKKIQLLEDRAIGLIHQSLSELLDTPEDLSMMYLTPRPITTIAGHEEAELLIEAYLMEIDHSMNLIENMAADIDTVEREAGFHIYITRNNLQRLVTRTIIIAAACGTGGIVSGLFGMNLNSAVQLEPYWFGAVCIGVASWTILFVCIANPFVRRI